MEHLKCARLHFQTILELNIYIYIYIYIYTYTSKSKLTQVGNVLWIVFVRFFCVPSIIDLVLPLVVHSRMLSIWDGEVERTERKPERF